MTLDVRFHNYLTEEDINNWLEYFWTINPNKVPDELWVNKIAYDNLLFSQAVNMGNIMDGRTRAFKWLNKMKKDHNFKTIKFYETYFGRIKIVVKEESFI